MERYGTTEAQLAAVAAKNHRHSAHDPYAQFRDVHDVVGVLASRRGLTGLVEIAGQAMTTDTGESLASGSCIDVVGRPMSRDAAGQAYERAGLGIEDVDVRAPRTSAPLGRADLQGASARCDRPGPDGRAGVAAARHGGGAAGAGRAGGLAHHIGLGGAAVVTVLRAA